jgi:hypothetical protein
MRVHCIPLAAFILPCVGEFVKKHVTNQKAFKGAAMA